MKTSPYLAQYMLRLELRDPVFLLAEVAWGALDAAPLGTSTVNGVPANGYLVHVDAARAVGGRVAGRSRASSASPAGSSRISGGTLGAPRRHLRLARLVESSRIAAAPRCPEAERRRS